MTIHKFVEIPPDASGENLKIIQAVDLLLSRSAKAQRKYGQSADQRLYDNAALAVAWALMQPERNNLLSKLAVETTGLGNIKDKITKNHRKTLGLLYDIKDKRTTGVIGEFPEKGLTEIARPVGIVGAVVPSTNPVATPVNNIINALKCGNSILLSPSPKGFTVCEKLLGFVYEELDKVGVDRDLVLMLPPPASKVATQRLMQSVDLLVVTGSQDNVRRAYSSGTPALGVGSGNVSVIVDETANLEDAASKIIQSKTFDNSTSCSSENNLIVLRDVYDNFVKTMESQGGLLLNSKQVGQVVDKLWQEGKLNRKVIAQDIEVAVNVFGLELPPNKPCKLLMAPTQSTDKSNPLCGEKMSLVSSLYIAEDFEHAKKIATEIFHNLGAGHSIGLHSSNDARAMDLGLSLPTCRVVVNQAHCFATGGAFNNGMPFSLSMGCGSWGGNSIDQNLNYKHFMNITKVIRTIPEKPSVTEEIFESYWKKYGK